jgi:hypothetical protein
VGAGFAEACYWERTKPFLKEGPDSKTLKYEHKMERPNSRLQEQGE